MRLGVLQASAPGLGAIQFDPAPGSILKTARSLQFGQVYVAEALGSLARILNRKILQPEAVTTMIGITDPVFRGAYSYVPVNGRRRAELSQSPWMRFCSSRAK